MSGRPFLQIPGPTLVPDRIVRAMAQPIIDHRGPRFEALVREQTRPALRRPDLGYDVTSGIQQRNMRR